MKKYLLLIIIAILLYFLLPKSVPILLALLTAVLFEPFVTSIIKRWKLKRGFSVLIVFVLFLSITGFISYIVLAKLIEQLIYFSNNLPFVLAKINILVGQSIDKWELFSANVPKDVIDSIEASFESLEKSILSWTSNLTQSVLLFITTIPQILIEILVYFIAVFLFSLELPRLKLKILEMFSEKTKEKILVISKQLNRAGVGFLKAQVLFSALTFVLAYVGLLILKVDYPILLSIVIVIVDILPVLGTGSVLVPFAVYCFVTGQQDTGIGLIIMFLIITVVRRVIEPKVYSSSMGISPLASLISMYLGFQIIGFLGLIVGPTVIIIFDTFKKAGIIKYQFKL
ncbi:sporulation integral membrane protein YtvI [Bacillus suaedaesalsae]|uniref:Sporulation integral membrane protein YtvI n=1 Tax=Bacillus suaedaesalsae TaxID=2810349 RepID=A0ABS2DLN7_9BACI|nr:sporulation integral membrane protein YtvI [Bacillus suaedaesalsae]MBM6619401.1 sporulation integral membrane protein YtvI [Bacillus suaedaesalsae]